MHNVNMFDTQKVLLEVNPLLADGNPDIGVIIDWQTSDAGLLALEIAPDTRTCWCVPVVQNGEATITVSASGYLSEEIKITYAQRRNLNLVVNEPIERE